eukprot:gene12333-12466_t
MWYKSSKGEDPVQQVESSVEKARGQGPFSRGEGIPCNGTESSESPTGCDGSKEALPLVHPAQPLEISIVTGPLVTELHQVWADWAVLTTRLWRGAAWIDQEWTVGPIPGADGEGREIIIRTTTNLSTGGSLFTDSNGREMLRRQLNTRQTWQLEVKEPVAGNYYPMTSAAALTDGCLSLGLATERAQGVASLQDGQLEVMVHRVTAVDDARGVGEPLNETLCGCSGCTCKGGGLPARGHHLIMAGPATGASAVLRQAAQQLNDPVLLAFAGLPQPHVAPSDAQRATTYATAGAATRSLDTANTGSTAISSISGSMISSMATPLRGRTAGGDSISRHKDSNPADARSQRGAALGLHRAAPGQGIIASLGLRGRWSGLPEPAAGLPANVHLLTLMRADEQVLDKLIVRLAHMFQVGEDSALSLPATIDLSKLLVQPVANITELSLTAAQYKAHMAPPVAWKEGPLLGVSPAEADITDDRTASRKPPAAVGNAWHSVHHQAAAADVDQCYAARTSAAASQGGQGWTGPLLQQMDKAKVDEEEEQQQRQATSRWRRVQQQDALDQQVQQTEHQVVSDAAQAAMEAGVYNIWDHSGDKLPVVELFPMEIRTFEVTLAGYAAN